MMAKAARFFIPVILALLFAPSTVFAQISAPKATPQYLDFTQFSTIVSADQLSFLDKLKRAGMKFVNAPAEKRVVSLYEYSKKDFENYECSDKQLQEHHALLVAQLISKTSDNAARSVDPRDEKTLNKLKAMLKAAPWLTREDLEHAEFEPETLQRLGIKAEPVWHEIAFSNSCELQKMVVDLDYKAVGWHVVDDPKLRSIIQSRVDTSMSASAFKPGVIATTSFFSKSSGQRQYFAECQPNHKLKAVGASLCDKVLR